MPSASGIRLSSLTSKVVRGEAAAVQADVAGGFHRLEEIVDFERVAVALEPFAQPGFAVGVTRVDFDFLHAFGREDADGPEHEEDIDFDALAAHFPGEGERSEQAVEGVVADDDGQAR